MENILNFLKMSLKIYRSKIFNNCIELYSCSSFTCLASGFKSGDEVIVPAQTHTATAHAVEYTGAKVAFFRCRFNYR